MKRVVLLLPAVFGLVFSGLAMTNGASASSSTGSLVVPVDRQDYKTAVTTTNPYDGSIVDPYDGDPSSIHVAIQGGQTYAQSYVHLALSYLPDGAQASAATLTLQVTQKSDEANAGSFDTFYNINESQAIVMACALTTELPAKFDYSNPPAYDCQHGSAVAQTNADHSAFTFQLKDLLGYWKQHGNTGAALIPVGSNDPNQNWAVSFYKSRSSSDVSYTIPAPPAPAAQPSAAAQPQPVLTTAPARITTTLGPSRVLAQPAAPKVNQPTAAPVQSPVVSQPAPASTTSNNTSKPVWPWVLVGCLALTAGALGYAHREALVAAVRGGGVPGFVRAHPRAYALAAAATAWGLVFSGYSYVTTTTPVQNLASTSSAGQVNNPANAPAGQATNATRSGAGKTSTVAGGASTSTSYSGTTSRQAPTSNEALKQAVKDEFAGPGSYRYINGVKVFFPANGGPPVADLYHGADDTIGLSPNQIELCAHAALTYGSAFHISASDLNVYWQWVNDHGGIFGRKVNTDYENDNYDPGAAVQAAQKCKDLNTFFLIGGIGFDQIPAVRQWAEQNHELYIHHVATIEGSSGLRFSFSMLPTVEQMGQDFGELAVQQFHNLKVGIIYRESSNWQPGSDAFEQKVKDAGMTVVGAKGVTINQGNYTQELTELHTAGAQLVFVWENALATAEIVTQAQQEQYHFTWLVFPFNIETQTWGKQSSLQDPFWGVAAWDAYDPNYYGGGFASYASSIHEFEAQYKQYDPDGYKNLGGDGGDLLFLNWEAQKQIDDLLTLCGAQCTRNKLAGILLAGYNRTVPPNCNINFGRTDDHHHGGYLFNVLEVQDDPNGRANFVPVDRCVSSV